MDKESRTYKSSKNVSYGLILAVSNAIVGFVNRTFFVKYLGPDYLGLNGLFTEVIAVLSLAELGIGMAINYSLYRPIHDKDEKKICQLMALFRKSYNIISAVVFILGLVVLPFVHHVVTETTFPISYIRLVFFLFLVNTSVSYLFSYNTSFVSANQQQFVVSIVQIIFRVIFSVLTILLLILTQNYILYLVLLIIQTFGSNVVLTLYVQKNYSFINYHDRLSKEETRAVFRDIKNICIKKISGVVTTSTDNILISTLVSTIQVGFYSNYTVFFSLIRTVKNQFSSGTKASIGDMMVSESPLNCIAVLKRLTFLYYAFATIVCSVLLVCSKDIITLWLGPNYVMEDLIVVVAIFNLYIEIWSEPLWQYLEVSGLFKKDRDIALLGTTVNLIISIVFGIKWGIVGIFGGTVFTQLIQLILKTRLVFRDRFEMPAIAFYRVIGKCLGSFIVPGFLFFLINRYIIVNNLWLSIILKGGISCIVAALSSLIFFFNTDELSYALQVVKKYATKWKR